MVALRPGEPTLIRSVAFVARRRRGGLDRAELRLGFFSLTRGSFKINNSQIQGRDQPPRLIDLVAALATGAVGAFALVRSDVSDALPGVAIAISLVPPLGVVGLLLQDGALPRPGERGSLLLFATNVAAIVATGTVVLIGYRVRTAAVDTGRWVGRLRARTIVVVALLVVIVTVPLGAGSYQAFRTQAIITTAQPAAERWAQARSLTIVGVTVRQGVLQVAAVGPPRQRGRRVVAPRARRGGAGRHVHSPVAGRRRFAGASRHRCGMRCLKVAAVAPVRITRLGPCGVVDPVTRR